MKPGDLNRILEDLEASKFFSPCLTSKVYQDARPGRFASFPEELCQPLQEALRERGISRLYSHQEEAYRRVRSGQNIVIVTPTASGKTLGYNLPVLDDILRNPGRRALYLFPTKALAQDQSAELRALITGMDKGLKVHTYDGDTPGDVRRVVRKTGHVVISNPDMLHAGILPHHTKWNDFFANLAYVVIDEMHSYRGVFGSHMVNLLRRLHRVCRHYGSSPRFIFCSATIANPKEVAEGLIEREVFLIDQNGAPQGEKRFYFVNPPVIQKEIGLRSSPLTMVQRIAHKLLRNGNSTIIFTTSRLTVEILTKYLKDMFRKTGPKADKSIRGYRGGYLPKQRREIESGLREGRIKGVVSTNALELGVDIGSLEACVLCGYPGSIASTWQQAGRAGRRTGLSCSILVARSTPLDQFIVHHPDYFFGRSPERARMNPDNLSILVSHIKCAAFEMPFQRGEEFGETDLEEVLNYLVEKQVLSKRGDRWYWADEAYPSGQISLRSATAENFVVVDRANGNQVVAEVDYESAPLSVYPGAIYMLESQQYQVEELDYHNRKAYVNPVEVEYYTEAVMYTKLKILDLFVSDPKTREEGRPVFQEGEVHVVNHVPGFKKLKFYTTENLGYGEVALPDQEMHTTAFWVTVGLEDAHGLELSVHQFLGALAGSGYAMQHMASFLLMCESRDLGKCVGDPYLQWFFNRETDLHKLQSLNMETEDSDGQDVHEAYEAQNADDETGAISFQPTLFLYDACPGGVGLSTALFSCRTELIEGSLSIIEECSCETGCPSCVGPSLELGEQVKENAKRLLKWMI